MKLAIADPPYLGRAALWYGGKGATKRPKDGCWKRVRGRPEDAPEYHPDAADGTTPRDTTTSWTHSKLSTTGGHLLRPPRRST